MKMYYIVVDGQQQGPFDINRLGQLAISPSTLVWTEGMSNWQPASEIGDLAFLFNSTAADEQPKWFVRINNIQTGPFAHSQLFGMGIMPDTPVWRNGMPDWMQACTQPELNDVVADSTRNSINVAQHPTQQPPIAQPPYSNPSYGQTGPNPGYGNPQFGTPRQHTNWLTWAIVATVTGTLFSCIGLIFGIIAISKSSKANDAYAVGDDTTGDMFNSSARTNTIIAFIFAGIGLLATIGLIGSGLLTHGGLL